MNIVAAFKAAIDARLTQSQLTAWLVLMMQTACYGKAEDDLADSRLEKLSGLRRDRARTAVQGVVDAGLFEVVGKGKYGTIYRIPESFRQKGKVRFAPITNRDEQSATFQTPPSNTDTDLPTLLDTYLLLTEIHQLLASSLPDQGEQLANSGLDDTRKLVTNINKPIHNKTTTTLTNNGDAEEQLAATPTTNQLPVAASCAIDPIALQYPETLNAEERAQAPLKLDGLHPDIAQEVLDALAWKMANGEVKKSNIGLLHWLASQARDGNFDRTPALEWRKHRQETQRKQANIAMTELNNLANEIRQLQWLVKMGGETDQRTIAKIEQMKTCYWMKLESFTVAQQGNR